MVLCDNDASEPLEGPTTRRTAASSMRSRPLPPPPEATRLAADTASGGHAGAAPDEMLSSQLRNRPHGLAHGPGPLSKNRGMMSLSGPGPSVSLRTTAASGPPGEEQGGGPSRVRVAAAVSSRAAAADSLGGAWGGPDAAGASDPAPRHARELSISRLRLTGLFHGTLPELPTSASFRISISGLVRQDTEQEVGQGVGSHQVIKGGTWWAGDAYPAGGDADTNGKL